MTTDIIYAVKMQGQRVIPAILPTKTTSTAAAFTAELRTRGFEGDITCSTADRTIFATDNSIYEIPPQGVLFPRNTADLVRIARTASDPRFHHVSLTPRGGGTGTNGQALNSGFVVDLSRHMNRVISIDPVRRCARVEAGVVKDQLNDALKPYGLFFAPELSSSSRATLGGMISTDAAGQGSRHHGKTRDYVQSLTVVLVDGTVWTCSAMDENELQGTCSRDDQIGKIHRVIDNLYKANKLSIEAFRSNLTRCTTGYDLAHLRRKDGQFDLSSILCGSEGTLCFIVEAELRLLPIPASSGLLCLRYDSFDTALGDVQRLLGPYVTSIETIDGKILSLARGDPHWPTVAAFFPDDIDSRVAGINLLETQADSTETLTRQIALLESRLRQSDRDSGRRGYTVATNDAVVAIWAMRKRAVGLLGNLPGISKPVAFVEDTAVPPQHLRDYIREFREILEKHKVDYGMFGHADAGVMHVRPAINMTDPHAMRLVRSITDEVFALTQKYNGALWGEHGKGFRSEYAPVFFGSLYPLMEQVKRTFDPNFQLNPGKIVAKRPGNFPQIDKIPFRGQFDRKITGRTRKQYEGALHCNGNAACYDSRHENVMCPSWKATGERRYSPKGRASLIRSWLGHLVEAGIDPIAKARQGRTQNSVNAFLPRAINTLAKIFGVEDFSHEVKDAMDTCLSCKGCTGQCPVKVDIPHLKAHFLELYYGRYLRSPGLRLIASIETLAPVAARFSGLSNLIMKTALFQTMAETMELLHLPRVNQPPVSLQRRFATRQALTAATEDMKRRSVVLVQDTFTTFFEIQVVLDIIEFLEHLGFVVWLAPYRPSGKSLHGAGMLKAFQMAARANSAMLSEIDALGIPLVGIDPAVTLAYRDEYRKGLGSTAVPKVFLIQEWLAENLGRIARSSMHSEAFFFLLPHCTEQAIAPNAVKAWSPIFEHLGSRLSILPVGCCGMAGAFGHQVRWRKLSEAIYALSWKSHVRDHAATGSLSLLATGYSCRSQARIIDGANLLHPVQGLLRLITTSK